MKARIYIAARYLIGILLIVWLTRSGLVDWVALRERLRAWDLLLLPLAMLMAAFVAASWRLVELLKGRDLHMSLVNAIRLSLVGNLFNLVLPAGGGDVARFYYASSSASGRRTEVATIMIMDRVVGLVTLLVTPLLALPFLGDALAASPVLRSIMIAAAITVCCVVTGLALIIVPRHGVAAPLAWVMNRLPFQRYRELIVGALRGYRERPGAMARACLASVVTHLLMAVAFSLLYFQGADGQWPLAAAVALLGFVANSLPLTPSGIGVGEAAFEMLFRQAGLPGGAETLLSWRVLLFALAPIGLVIHLRGLRISLSAPPP